MGQDFQPALMPDINSRLVSFRQKWKQTPLRPTGLIGGGYNGAVAYLLQTLGNPMFFSGRSQPTRVIVHGSRQLSIESVGDGLSPLWLNLCRSWEADDVLWSFNLLRENWNKVQHDIRDPFDRCVDRLADLGNLSLLWPFSNRFSYEISSGARIFKGEAQEGLLISAGRWASTKSEISFQLKLTMDDSWFPGEAFSETVLQTMIFERELFAEVCSIS